MPNNPNNTTHDRLDDLQPSLLDMTFEQQMERVKEIRRGRVQPAKKKSVKPKAAKSRGKKLDTLIQGFTPEQMAALADKLKKRT